MFKKASVVVSSLIAILLPVVAFAQAECTSSKPTLCSLINQIIFYANQVLVLLMGLAVVMFVWYIIKYFIRADADRTDAGKYVMYSLIGFFIILSMWGLVNILQNTFNLGNEQYRPSSWNSFTNIFPGGGSSSRSGGSVQTTIYRSQ